MAYHTDAGHHGGRNCLFRISRCFFWKGMRSEIMRTVSKCVWCCERRASQRYYGQSDYDRRTLNGSDRGQCWDTISIDICGPLPPCSASAAQYVLAATCHFSRFTHLAVMRNVRSTTICSTLSDIFDLYGSPRVIRSDRQFDIAPVRRLLLGRGTRLAPVCVASPWSNGLVERRMAEIKFLLLTNGRRRTSWSLMISKAMRRLNTGVLPGGLVSPFELFHRRRYVQRR